MPLNVNGWDLLQAGDRIEWTWRGKDRLLDISSVSHARRMVFGKDPKTGKTWQVEYPHIKALVR